MAKRQCKFYSQGRCTRGADCTFLHEGEPGVGGGPVYQSQPPRGMGMPPSPQSNVCRYYQRGSCAFGPACRFAHPGAAAPPPGAFVMSPGVNPIMGGGPMTAPENTPCRYWLRGSCNFGDGCMYLHVGPPGAGMADYDGGSSPTSVDLDGFMEANIQGRNQSETHPDTWYVAFRDCGCCNGYIYGCKGDACEVLGMCGCAVAKDSDDKRDENESEALEKQMEEAGVVDDSAPAEEAEATTTA